VESARSLCYAAAFAADDGEPAHPSGEPARLTLLAAAAKAHCSHALTRAAAEMSRPDEHIARVAAALIDG
jgi:hypothetical protein